MDLVDYLTIEPDSLTFDDIKDVVSLEIETQIFGTATLEDTLLDYEDEPPEDVNIYAFAIQLLISETVVDRLIIVIYPTETETEYDDWVDDNEDTDWLDELPPVYSELADQNADPEPGDCDPQHWRDVNNNLPEFFHFNAEFEIRSEQTDGRHGHQACYDANGDLIVGGSLEALASSGTADFAYWANVIPPYHVLVDVRPYIRAAQLDGNPVEGEPNALTPTSLSQPLIRIGPQLRNYFQRRPAHTVDQVEHDECINLGE